MEYKKDPVETKYDIGDDIGKGQFATVKRCREKGTGHEFAAKFIRKRRGGGRRGAKMEDIEREIEILGETNHRNIINLYDVYETNREVILIIELVDGGELFEYLAEKDKLCEEEASSFVKQILDGVEHLHARYIAHLDLKPENILLQEKNSTAVKLIDFGLSRKIGPKEEHRALMGTAEFVAPEVVSFEPLSTATDMWSVGVITYILLSGASPFLGDNQQETYHNITAVNYQFDEEYFNGTSDMAKDFIQKLLVKDMRKRSTINDCMNHPWIKPLEKKQKDLRRISIINTEHLKKFLARQRWKRSLKVVSLCNRLSRSMQLRRMQSSDTLGSCSEEASLNKMVQLIEESELETTDVEDSLKTPEPTVTLSENSNSSGNIQENKQGKAQTDPQPPLTNPLSPFPPSAKGPMDSLLNTVNETSEMVSDTAEENKSRSASSSSDEKTASSISSSSSADSSEESVNSDSNELLEATLTEKSTSDQGEIAHVGVREHLSKTKTDTDVDKDVNQHTDADLDISTGEIKQHVTMPYYKRTESFESDHTIRYTIVEKVTSIVEPKEYVPEDSHLSFMKVDEGQVMKIYKPTPELDKHSSNAEGLHDATETDGVPSRSDQVGDKNDFYVSPDTQNFDIEQSQSKKNANGIEGHAIDRNESQKTGGIESHHTKKENESQAKVINEDQTAEENDRYTTEDTESKANEEKEGETNKGNESQANKEYKSQAVIENEIQTLEVTEIPKVDKENPAMEENGNHLLREEIESQAKKETEDQAEKENEIIVACHRSISDAIIKGEAEKAMSEIEDIETSEHLDTQTIGSTNHLNQTDKSDEGQGFEFDKHSSDETEDYKRASSSSSTDENTGSSKSTSSSEEDSSGESLNSDSNEFVEATVTQTSTTDQVLSEGQTADENESHTEDGNETQAKNEIEKWAKVFNADQTAVENENQTAGNYDSQLNEENESQTNKENESHGNEQSKRQAMMENEHQTINEHEKVANESHANEESKGQTMVENENQALMESQNQAVDINENQALMESQNQAVDINESQTLMESQNQAVNINENQALMESQSQAVDINENQALMESQYLAVDINESQALMESQSQAVDINESQALMESQNQAVDINESQALMESQSQAVDINESQALVESQSQTVDINESQALMESQSQAVDINESQALMESQSQAVDINESQALMENEIQVNKENDTHAKEEIETIAVEENESHVMEKNERQAMMENENLSKIESESQVVVLIEIQANEKNECKTHGENESQAKSENIADAEQIITTIVRNGQDNDAEVQEEQFESNSLTGTLIPETIQIHSRQIQFQIGDREKPVMYERNLGSFEKVSYDHATDREDNDKYMKNMQEGTMLDITDQWTDQKTSVHVEAAEEEIKNCVHEFVKNIIDDTVSKLEKSQTVNVSSVSYNEGNDLDYFECKDIKKGEDVHKAETLNTDNGSFYNFGEELTSDEFCFDSNDLVSTMYLTTTASSDLDQKERQIGGERAEVAVDSHLENVGSETNYFPTYCVIKTHDPLKVTYFEAMLPLNRGMGNLENSYDGDDDDDDFNDFEFFASKSSMSKRHTKLPRTGLRYPRIKGSSFFRRISRNQDYLRKQRAQRKCRACWEMEDCTPVRCEMFEMQVFNNSE